MNKSKKEEEKLYLHSFKELYNLFPDGKISDKESPDFIIESKGKKIGIELSKIFQDSKMFGIESQAVDSMSESITKLISELLLKYTIPLLDVSIIFTFHHRLNSKERLILANKIVALILLNVPAPNTFIALENDFENKEHFPWEVTRLRIFNFPILDKHFIHHSFGGWVQENFVEEIQDILNKKNKKLSSFRACDFYWLIIHTVSFSSGSIFEPSIATLKHSYDCAFDKLFFLDYTMRKLYELNISIIK